MKVKVENIQNSFKKPLQIMERFKIEAQEEIERLVNLRDELLSQVENVEARAADLEHDLTTVRNMHDTLLKLLGHTKRLS